VHRSRHPCLRIVMMHFHWVRHATRSSPLVQYTRLWWLMQQQVLFNLLVPPHDVCLAMTPCAGVACVRGAWCVVHASHARLLP
jgi:hypothetical protein